MESTVLNWRKSSYSGGNGGSCVEAGNVTDRVLIRDTTQHGNGPVLAFSTSAWKAFAAKVKRSLAPDPTGVCTPVGATLVPDGRGWPSHATDTSVSEVISRN